MNAGLGCILATFQDRLISLIQTDAGGIAVALTLIILVTVLARQSRWKKVRGSIFLLALHLLALAAEGLTVGTALARPFDLLGLFFLLSCIGRTLFILFTQVIFVGSVGALPKIFLDIIHVLIFAAVLLFILSMAGVEPGSLITGSAVLTAVIGLSLRDTLGNLFAGVAIQAQRPFEVGDWIQFDEQPAHIGEVVEINWRATKVVTLDAVEIIVPNGTLGLAKIVNFSRPKKWSRRSLYVHAPFDFPPQRVQEIILAALQGSWGVLTNPPPSVVTNAFDERGIQYWVRFFTTEFDKRDRVDGGARDRIWYALTRHGLGMPAPRRQVRLEDAAEQKAARREEEELSRRIETLGCVDFLAPLAEEVRRELASLSRTRLYAAGEAIIRQGEPGEELFIVQTGEVAVTLERPGESSVEVARLGPRSFFGEMSLLTGEPRTATVQAARECEVLVVNKAAIGQVLEEHPELAEGISAVIAHRQAGLLSKQGEPAPVTDSKDGDQWRLLKRIREFFSK